MLALPIGSRSALSRILLVLSAIALGIAANRSAAAFDEPKKPKLPFAIEKPKAQPKEFKGQDLTKADAGAIYRAAREAVADRDYRAAVQLQYWAVQAGDDGRYDLACYCAMTADKDAAFYWLQDAALNEGVDAGWANEDSDLALLRKDLRWSRILRFIKECNGYWATSGRTSTTLVLPKGYKVGQPIGVAVGLHGLGADPTGFVNEGWQKYADELNQAIIGVSGTLARGPRSYVWSEDPKKDAERIRRALKEVADRVTVKPGEVVTFGFSQGAQMAFEVALLYPDEFRGAIVMSPGTVNQSRLGGFESSPGNRKQGFVCLCGAGEMPGNVANTKAAAEIAKRSGAKVDMKLYEGVTSHTFPPDFGEKFVGWVNFIAKAGSGK